MRSVCPQGGPPFVGDVAIKDGKILAVGPSLDIDAAEEVDATGRHVMPGWTDVHSHFVRLNRLLCAAGGRARALTQGSSRERRTPR